jgi:PRTRC genetic system ThiF family protein
MQTLTIEPPVPHLVPAAPLTVVLVGCGGTGSHLAQSLARLAVHLRDQGQPFSLCFIDGDHVEAQNVGRQLFAPSDSGSNKAQVLAARFSALFGLDIVACPRMADSETLLRVKTPSVGGQLVLVGAVDSHTGRQAMEHALRSTYRYWIDCGNHERAGQVVVGTTGQRSRMQGAIAFGGICTDLPAASLLYPELLAPPAPAVGLDCAAAMQTNAQSLMVNQMMAAIAAQYLYQLVVQRRLTTFQTVVDLDSLSMRSTPITARTLAEMTGLTVAEIEGVKGENHAAV